MTNDDKEKDRWVDYVNLSELRHIRRVVEWTYNDYYDLERHATSVEVL